MRDFDIYHDKIHDFMGILVYNGVHCFELFIFVELIICPHNIEMTFASRAFKTHLEIILACIKC